MKKFFMPVLQISLYLSLSLSAWSNGPLYISEHLMDWGRGDSGSMYQEWTFDSTPVLVNPEYRDHDGQLCGPNDPNSQLHITCLYPDISSISFDTSLLWIYGGGTDSEGNFKGLVLSNGMWSVVGESASGEEGLISTWPQSLDATSKIWIEVGYLIPEDGSPHFFMPFFFSYYIDRIVGMETVGQEIYFRHVMSCFFDGYETTGQGFCLNGLATGAILDYVFCDTLWGTSRIDQVDFATLAFYWGDINCDSGQPCEVADWYADGKIDIYDLIWLAENWLFED